MMSMEIKWCQTGTLTGTILTPSDFQITNVAAGHRSTHQRFAPLIILLFVSFVSG